MFEFVRAHTRLFQLLLLLLIFPSFVFFGVQGYTQFTEGARDKVADISGSAITQTEWNGQHQRQVQRIRAQNPETDAALLDSPEARAQVLEGLVRERVLQVAGRDMHLAVSDERVANAFRTDPQWAPMRNADGSVNKDLLASQGMSSAMFVAQIAQEMQQQQVMRGVVNTAMASPATARAAMDALLQRREVSYQLFNTRDYLTRVTPTDADLEAFHKANQSMFRSPEQASIEYAVLDIEELKKGITVPEQQLKDYYEQNASRYTQSEERRARHILIKADASSSADARQKARAEAERLLAEVRRNGAAFVELARKHSQDEGSAASGGDLDFNRRGAMVKPFDDAMFAMKPGEISPIIDTEFGYHIIKLEAVRGGERQAFEAVRAGIEDELRKQEASKKWAEAAENFTNTVYEQADSLQPALDKLKLAKRTATVQRTPATGATGVLASRKLLEAVFAGDSVRNKRNTAAVEVGSNQLASARVVSHQPARDLPLAEVKDQVRARVAAQQAAALARKDGEARLAELKKSPADGLTDKVTISRVQPQGLTKKALDQMLAADTAKLPAVLGVDLEQAGYVVARVDKVLPAELKPEEAKSTEQQYTQAVAQAEWQAYYEALKARYKVSFKAGSAASAAAAATPASR
ncbi:MAG: SurA N-terminal domain-containing protein [Aquabacterium sp.]